MHFGHFGSVDRFEPAKRLKCLQNCGIIKKEKGGGIMKASFYKKLQDDFVMIRFMQYPDSFDQEKYDSTVLSIREARKKINMHSVPAEKNILLYCIDTLFEILNEGDKQKIFDFADAIHNIPEIYMQKRNLYSFRKELKAFQKKYGKHYFAFINEVKPHFTKKTPICSLVLFL